MTRNKALKETQGFAKQEISDEVKNFINHKVKVLKEEKEKDKISFKEYLTNINEIQSEHGKKKVIKTKENDQRCSREEKKL